MLTSNPENGKRQFAMLVSVFDRGLLRSGSRDLSLTFLVFGFALSQFEGALNVASLVHRPNRAQLESKGVNPIRVGGLNRSIDHS